MIHFDCGHCVDSTVWTIVMLQVPLYLKQRQKLMGNDCFFQKDVKNGFVQETFSSTVKLQKHSSMYSESFLPLT